MSYLLPSLQTKAEINNVIRETEDCVVTLRFGRADDTVCLRLDHIVSECGTTQHRGFSFVGLSGRGRVGDIE